MPAKRHQKISSCEVASAYQCSRQNANVLLKRYGSEIVENPDALLAEMLKRQASQIRFKLACPDYRKQAARSMQGAFFRQALRDGLKTSKP